MKRKKRCRIGIIGAGVMGAVLATNFINQRIVNRRQLAVSDKNYGGLRERQRQLGINIYQNNAELLTKAVYVILAVKPQDFAALANEIASHLQPQHVVISIMAGVPLRQLKTRLGINRIIRSMPNLAARVGQAFTVWKSGFRLNQEEKIIVNKIFRALGQSISVTNEDDINKATAISGSGPAYVYYFMELLEGAAHSLGFSEKIARAMVEQTMRGALAVYEKTGQSPAVLRRQVTSKRGTTEAAIKSFAKSGLKSSVRRAVKAAYRRARDLAQ